jgi:hypothetical protein
LEQTQAVAVTVIDVEQRRFDDRGGHRDHRRAPVQATSLDGRDDPPGATDAVGGQMPAQLAAKLGPDLLDHGLVRRGRATLSARQNAAGGKRDCGCFVLLVVVRAVQLIFDLGFLAGKPRDYLLPKQLVQAVDGFQRGRAGAALLLIEPGAYGLLCPRCCCHCDPPQIYVCLRTV